MPSRIGLSPQTRNVLLTPRLLPVEGIRSDQAGNLTLPADLLAQAGLDPTEDLICEAVEGGLRLGSDTLRKVYVEVTSLCNLSCATCIRRAWHEPLGHMPPARFQRLLEGLPRPGPRNEVTLSFAGFGEPLAHPDFLEMVHLARAQGMRVELITNGTLLDAGLARALVELEVAQVAVSIDGGDEVTYAGVRGGQLQPVLAGVAALHKARRLARAPLSIGLAFVAMRRNVGSLPALLRLAADLEADFVSVSNVVPHTPEMAAEALWSRAAWVANFPVESWWPRLIMGRMDLDDVTRPALEAVWGQGLVTPLPEADAGRWRNRCRFVHEGVVAVAWDGRVAPCLSLLHTHPEYINGQWKTVQSYTVGHVDEQPLSAIWRDSTYRDFRRRVRVFDFPPCFACGGCPSTETNEEDCYGDPFPVCSECLWAQGIVLCP